MARRRFLRMNQVNQLVRAFLLNPRKSILMVSVLGVWILLINSPADQGLPVEKAQDTTTEASPVKRIKTILYWTTYYNETDFGVGLGQTPLLNGGCPVTNCFFTNNRSLFNESDAVIFHALQYQLNDLPKYRLPHQRFVFFLYETIPNTTIPCVGKCLPPHIVKYPNYFNWTMTHRRDSDIYIAHHYGAVGFNSDRVPRQLPDDLPAGVLPPQASLMVQRQSYPELKNRTKKIAWFNSHCPTHSQREDYAAELSKYIPVDIYGQCGPLKCSSRDHAKLCEPMLSEYKFYLAFENSICPDYVSEKFYRALDNGIVPVVYGGADYSEYAPPHSFINVADFASPKALAEYLLLLDANDALYMTYLRWRKHFHVIRRPMKGWCDLCAKLNDPVIERKSYDNVADWWVRKLPCYPGSSFLASQKLTA